jgi:hypothetical protein
VICLAPRARQQIVRRRRLADVVARPLDRVDEAKEHLAQVAVPEDELTKLALSYPPPDDAGDLGD